MVSTIVMVLAIVVINSALSLIPMRLGKKKGYPPGVWYLYSFFIGFLPALIHCAHVREADPDRLKQPGFFKKVLYKPSYMGCLVGIVYAGLFIFSVVAAKNAVQSGNSVPGSDSKVVDTEPKVVLAFFDLKQFMINIKDEDSTSLARIKLNFAYPRDNIRLLTELNQNRARIWDIILLFFGNKRKQDFDSSSKKQSVKQELLLRINKELKTGKLVDIYYEEFSVQ